MLLQTMIVSYIQNHEKRLVTKRR